MRCYGVTPSSSSGHTGSAVLDCNVLQGDQIVVGLPACINNLQYLLFPLPVNHFKVEKMLLRLRAALDSRKK
jgi:hypothetical protein